MRPASFATLTLAITLVLAHAQSEPAPIAHTPFPTTTSTPLATQISTLLADPRVARAHWGIAVTELDGTPIYGLDEGKLFRPASNAKLFTTAAAMALLGSDATVSTTVEGNMKPDGTVEGDLHLVGHGDANFGSDDVPYIAPKLRIKKTEDIPLHDLDELVTQLKQAGLKQVRGDVVGDDSQWPYQPVVDSWDIGDLVWGYGSPVSALSIADNQLRLTITPAPRNAPAMITLDQFGIPFYSVSPEVRTETKGAGTLINVERTGPHAIRVYGSIGSDAKSDTEEISIDEPALFAAMALRQRLVAAGIPVGGTAKAAHSEPFTVSEIAAPLANCEMIPLGGGENCVYSCLSRAPGKILASHASPVLSQDVALTLKISQNLHAELLSRRIGERLICAQPTPQGGSRLTRGFLQKIGLDPADFVFYDGSGLSGHDLITPRSAAQLLTYATKQPWFAQWKAALPVGGEDGSLASRFPDAPIKNHVFAKTGTLGESRALSGYLDCASGKQVIFSVLVDDHAPSGSNDREVMDKIVGAIAANN